MDNISHDLPQMPLPSRGGPPADGGGESAPDDDGLEVFDLGPIAAALVAGGGMTLTLPGQPPYIMQPTDDATPTGTAVTVFDSRAAVEKHLRRHPELFESGGGRLEILVWEPDRLAYVVDCAHRVSGVDITVKVGSDLPLLVDADELLAAFAAAGLTLLPDERRPGPYPPANQVIDAKPGPVGPVFALRV
jgi:hypothetical protein